MSGKPPVANATKPSVDTSKSRARHGFHWEALSEAFMQNLRVVSVVMTTSHPATRHVPMN
jgi:hypothetical protein